MPKDNITSQILTVKQVEATLNFSGAIDHASGSDALAAVLVTCSTNPHSTYDSLVTKAGSEQFLAPKFMRVSTAIGSSSDVAQ